MGKPVRLRGRPALPPGESKQHPLTFRATTELRDALLGASQASGRSLAEEIEVRLRRSLAEEQNQVLPEPVVIRLDAVDRAFKGLISEVITLMRDCWRGDDQSLEEFFAEKSDQNAGDRAAGSQSQPARHADYSSGRLLPVEISVTRGDDGSVELVRRHGETIIAETPLDISTAQWLASELLAACGSSEKEEPASIEPQQQRKSRRGAR